MKRCHRQLLSLRRWLLLALSMTSGGCAAGRSASAKDGELALALARAQAGFIEGAIAELGGPTVLEDRDLVYAVALSPREERVAVIRLSSRAFHLSVHALSSPTPLADVRLNSYEHDVEDVAFSPDGALLAVASRDGALRVFSSQGDRVAEVLTDGPLVSLAFHPTRPLVAAGAASGDVLVYGLPSLELMARTRPHSDEVRALAFVSSGALHTGSWDRSVTRQAVSDGPEGVSLTEQARFRLEGFVNDLTVDARGERLGVAVSSRRALRTMELYQAEKAGVRPPPSAADTGLILSASSGAELGRWSGHRGIVSSAAISPDGRTLVTGGFDNRVMVHSAEQASPLVVEVGWNVRKVRFGPDGSRLGVAAWTRPNPFGDRRSRPSAMVFDVRYREGRVVARAPTPASD